MKKLMTILMMIVFAFVVSCGADSSSPEGGGITPEEAKAGFVKLVEGKKAVGSIQMGMAVPTTISFEDATAPEMAMKFPDDSMFGTSANKTVTTEYAFVIATDTTKAIFSSTGGMGGGGTKYTAFEVKNNTLYRSSTADTKDAAITAKTSSHATLEDI